MKLNVGLGRGRSIWWGIILGLALWSGISEPYWIAIPRIGNLDLWPALRLLAVAYPSIFIFLLGTLALDYWENQSPSLKPILRSILLTLIFYLLSIAFYALTIFSLWKDSPFAKFLLPPYSGYFQNIVLQYAQPYLFHVFSAIAAAALFLILFLLTRGRAVDRGEILLAAFLGLVLGPENTFLTVILAFVLAFLWFLYQSLLRHRSSLVRITPFLFLVSFFALLRLLPTSLFLR